jgi:transcriptional regulator with XRE-family HTH domain
MSGASLTIGKSANRAAEQGFGQNRTAGRLTDRLMQKARGLWSVKTAAQLSGRANVSSRAAEHWLSGKREISADALVQLLRSEEGIHFLVAVMEHARPKWWTGLLRVGLLGSIQRRREADLRLLRRVADADRPSTPKFSAALRLQDEDFYGPLLAGFDEAASAGAEGSAVDRPSKGARR